MKDYGLQKSSVKPSTREITENKVFVYSDIKEIQEENENGQITMYQFNLTEYDKDEFIQMLSEKNDSLESEITQTQMALCDVYEMLG